MPEKYRRPLWHERSQTIERTKRAWQDESEALLVVRQFNHQLASRGSAWFWPKITTALTAKSPWVVIICDSCGMAGELDLRMKPRDPEASVRVVLRDFRCPRCNGHGRPRIMRVLGKPKISIFINEPVSDPRLCRQLSQSTYSHWRQTRNRSARDRRSSH